MTKLTAASWIVLTGTSRAASWTLFLLAPPTPSVASFLGSAAFASPRQPSSSSSSSLLSSSNRQLFVTSSRRRMSSDCESTAPPPTQWSDISHSSSSPALFLESSRLFPPLTPAIHKGSHGRIAILGGSDKYTGAPYYAATSALRAGVDLATVFCATEAGVPIKCYSPELMVQGAYSVEELEGLSREEGEIRERVERLKRRNGGEDVIVVAATASTMAATATATAISKSKSKSTLIDEEEIVIDTTNTIKKQIQQTKSQQFTSLSQNLQQIQLLEHELQTILQKQQLAIQSSIDTISSSLSVCHVLCIGPGLGRHSLVFQIVAGVLRRALSPTSSSASSSSREKSSQLTIVLDADALYMLSLEEYRELYFDLRSYDKCVMTPNLMEWKRLKDAHHGNGDDEYVLLRDMQQLLQGRTNNNGNIIIQKGHIDSITSTVVVSSSFSSTTVGDQKVSSSTNVTTTNDYHYSMQCKEEGGMKRSGGIGDVLAGTISAFMAWNAIMENSEVGNGDTTAIQQQQQRLFACWAACCAVKRATKIAFDKKKRAMSAMDVLHEVGGVIGGMEAEIV